MDPRNRIYGHVAPIIQREVTDSLDRLVGKSYSNSSLDIAVSTVDAIPIRPSVCAIVGEYRE